MFQVSLLVSLLTTVTVVVAAGGAGPTPPSDAPSPSSPSSSASESAPIDELIKRLKPEFFQREIAPHLDIRSCLRLMTIPAYGRGLVDGQLYAKLLQVVVDSGQYDPDLPAYLHSLEWAWTRCGQPAHPRPGSGPLCRLYDRLVGLALRRPILTDALDRCQRLFPEARSLFPLLMHISNQPRDQESAQTWFVSPALVADLQARGVPVPAAYAGTVRRETDLIALFASANQLDLLNDLPLLNAFLTHGVRLRLVNVLAVTGRMPSAAALPLYQTFWPTDVDLHFDDHGRFSHGFFVDLDVMRSDDEERGPVALARCWRDPAVQAHFAGRHADLRQYLRQPGRFQLLAAISFPYLEAFVASDMFAAFIDDVRDKADVLGPLLSCPDLDQYHGAVLDALRGRPSASDASSFERSDADFLRDLLQFIRGDDHRDPDPEQIPDQIDIGAMIDELRTRLRADGVPNADQLTPSLALRNAFLSDESAFREFARSKTNAKGETLLHYAFGHLKYALLDALLQGDDVGVALNQSSTDGWTPLDFAWRWFVVDDLPDDDRKQCIRVLAKHALSIRKALQPPVSQVSPEIA